jgi:hypothetical protein
MVNKVISTIILATSVVFLALANSQPDNLLFLFVSSNKLIAASRVLLAAGMVLLSFKGLVSSPRFRQGVKYFGLSLIAFGALSMVITNLGSALYDYMKLLDVMMIAEAGVIFTSCAITLPAELSAPKLKTSKGRMKLTHKAA